MVSLVKSVNTEEHVMSVLHKFGKSEEYWQPNLVNTEIVENQVNSYHGETDVEFLCKIEKSTTGKWDLFQNVTLTQHK